MEATAKGLWILPTFGRASTNLPRFLAACAKTSTTTNIALVVDEADYAATHDAYDALELPDNIWVHLVKGGNCAQATREAMAELFTDDLAWWGWLADDLVPETPEWDVKAIAHLNGYNFVSTDDAMYAPNKANGATVWSAELLRAVGYIYPPDFTHFYCDTIWEEITKATGTWVCDMSILVRHVHASRGGDKDATFAKTNSAWGNDDPAFAKWRETEKSAAIDRVFALMGEHGAAVTKVNLDGFKVMIATPSGGGAPDRVFQRSLRETEPAVKFYGGATVYVELPFLSDIGLARSKLFGAFLRSDCTHLFFIDDDQGWQARDFIRLLLAKKDFVAVAGVRKVSPPSFAVSVQDEQGRALPIEEDAASGLLRATSVGMAFVCMSRACCDRLAQSYADLEFDSADGRTEIGIFLPFIRDRRWRSEDYAVCDRWRAIGGDIWVAPEVNLEHVGKYVWSGAWLDQLKEKSRKSV